MSELAFNANGDTFDVPATVSGWRVRRMKPRGAPELVYGPDGRPLTVPIESDVDDLREAVGTPGKYRLDPINDDGKCVEGVPPAYVQVVKPERNAAESVTALAAPSEGDAIREAMRLNTELARAVVDQFSDVVKSTAELIRAADGAGLPSRKPRYIEADDDVDDDDGEDDEPAAISSGFDLNALIAQLAPLLASSLMSGKMKLPSLAAMFDWRKAVPTNEPKSESAPAAKAPDDKSKAKATPEPSAPSQVPPLDPAAMAHVIAIQSALEPQEVAYVQEVAKDLSPAELRSWFDELSKLSVPDAVTRVRGLIAGKNNGAS